MVLSGLMARFFDMVLCNQLARFLGMVLSVRVARLLVMVLYCQTGSFRRYGSPVDVDSLASYGFSPQR